MSLWLLGAACTDENPPPLYSDMKAADGKAPTDGLADAKPTKDFSGEGKPTDARADAFSCSPGAFLSCKSSSQMTKCDPSGKGTLVVDCSPYQCDATSKRCNQCDPKSQATCQGNDLVSCTADGLLVKTACPNGCQNGACVSCTKKPYYKDSDGDGYGNPGVKVDECAQPAGFVANSSDCDDSDAAAHPGQTAFYLVPTKGTNGFDYNCDGVEQQELPSLSACKVAGVTCTGDGWVSSVPACGKAGTWGQCSYQALPPSCSLQTSSKLQACR